MMSANYNDKVEAIVAHNLFLQGTHHIIAVFIVKHTRGTATNKTQTAIYLFFRLFTRTS